MAILNDGFNTLITFPGAGVTFIEKEVTPPALDGGGPINTTAMRNTFWRTQTPKYLRTLDKLMVKVRYDALCYAAGQIRSAINVNTLVGLLFPTLTNAPARTMSFWGWLNKFAPETLKEGEEPLADLEVIPSLQNNGIETGPVTT